MHRFGSLSLNSLSQEMNPDDFRLILEVEEEEQSAVADSSNIDRDIYSVFWCAPFKFIESTYIISLFMIHNNMPWPPQ